VLASTQTKLKASPSAGKVLVSGQVVRPAEGAEIGYRCLSYTDPFGLNPCLVPPVAAACWTLISAGAGIATGALASPGFAEGAAAMGTQLLDNARTTLAVGALLVNNAVQGLASNTVFSKQDKKLSPGEIGALKDANIDVHELKTGGGGKDASKFDLFKNKAGDIFVKPKNGRGPGEPTGYNINDFMRR
jgi:hypothetical protein